MGCLLIRDPGLQVYPLKILALICSPVVSVVFAKTLDSLDFRFGEDGELEPSTLDLFCDRFKRLLCGLLFVFFDLIYEYLASDFSSESNWRGSSWLWARHGQNDEDYFSSSSNGFWLWSKESSRCFKELLLSFLCASCSLFLSPSVTKPALSRLLRRVPACDVAMFLIGTLNLVWARTTDWFRAFLR